METKFKETEIGRIPEEWTIKPLSKLVGSDKLDFIDGDWIESPYITSEGIRLIQTGNIDIGSFLDTTRRYVSEQTFVELKCKEVYSGDMLICRLASPIGRACIVPDTGEKYITAVDCTIVRPDSTIADKYYLNHFINWRRTLNLMERYGGGVTHQRISRKNLGKIPIPLPPLPEQRKIAAILSTVDETIEKTDAIIEETQQLKKGLMQKLFTEGIGHTRFKETKIGRIEYGTIPVDWDEVELNSICNVTSSKRIMMHEYVDLGIPFYRSKEIIEKMRGISHDKILYISESRFQEISRKFGAPQNGDILITAVGSLGVPYLIEDDERFYFKDGNLLWLRDFSGEIDKRFLIYYFESFGFKKVIEVITAGSSQKALTIEKLEKLRIPLPNSSEQKMITQILSEVDTKIEKEQDFKSELKQLKTGLMQVLLTGKARVKV